MSYTEAAEKLRNQLDPNALMELLPPFEDKPQLKIICMTDVQIEPVKWLWLPYIPFGKITILQGDPGLGKTFFATQLAAIISNGSAFPEGTETTEAGNVIFQTAEDGLGDTIKSRLIDAGANCSRIFVIDESAESLTLDDTRLREAIQLLCPKLVVIDPIQAYIGADRDMHRANEIRPIMARLGKLAANFGCAIVLIGHQNKASGGKSIYRGLGSIDIAAAARSVLAVGEVPEMKYRRAVVQIKSSLAANGQTILFDLDPALGFLWAGTSDLTADDVLNYHPAVERDAPERDDCAAYLKELLSDGPLPANEVWYATEASGFAEATVKRAKKALGIISDKETGRGGRWMWQLKEYHTKTHEPLDTVDTLTSKGYQEAQEYQVERCDTLTQIPLRGDL